MVQLVALGVKPADVMGQFALGRQQAQQEKAGELGMERVRQNMGVQREQLDIAKNSAGINQQSGKLDNIRRMASMIATIALGAKGGDQNGPVDPIKYEQGLDFLEANGMDVSKYRGKPEFANVALKDSLAVLKNPESFTTPVQAVDAQGNPTFIQVGNRGGVKPVEGYTPLNAPKTVDTGTGTALVDRTGKTINTIDKNIAEAEGQKKAAAQSIKIAGETFISIGKVRKNIANITQAIEALKSGASTGAIDQYLPSIRTASIELDNIQKRLGLDVIGDVTFGALSKGELDLALATAVPLNMNEADLIKWLVEKKAAQEKYASALLKAVRYLSKPGNTLNEWIEINNPLDSPDMTQQPSSSQNTKIINGKKYILENGKVYEAE